MRYNYLPAFMYQKQTISSGLVLLSVVHQLFACGVVGNKNAMECDCFKRLNGQKGPQDSRREHIYKSARQFGILER